MVMNEKLSVAPIQRSRLSTQITVQLCRMIRHGDLQPGDRLPPERQLTASLHVSRASLREALRVLEMAGIVTTRQGGGTFVRELADDGLLSPLLLILDVGGNLVGDLIELRMIFEPETASRAALRATDADHAELDRILHAQHQMFDVQTANDAWLLLDRQFHIAIARASHNEVSVRVTRFITEMLQDVQKQFFVASDVRVQHAYACHQEIVQAVREGEPQRARESMLQHLRDVEAFILQGVAARDASSRVEPIS